MFFALAILLSLLLGAGLIITLAGSPSAAGQWLVTHRALAMITQASSTLAGGAVATWLIGARVLGLDWSRLRYRGTGSAPAGFGWGAALGGGAAIAALLIPVAVGHAAWSADQGSAGSYAGALGRTLLVLAPAAFAEELLFRGVPLVLLGPLLGRVPAVLLLAGLFALSHLFNPGLSALAVANIFAAGVLLGFAFYTPGGIWTAFGAHLGWNAALAAADAPVSGLPFAMPYLDYHAGAPAWLTGGTFGPEGGVAATLAVGSAIAIAGRRLAREQR